MSRDTRMRQALRESSTAAILATLLAFIVFTSIAPWFADGWAGGDMLATYVNAHVWQGFNYAVTDQFGFPLGMNLNYFPGIDITENTFAKLIDLIAGEPFIGINLLVFLTFPLVAFLSYFLFRLVGLRGALAITGAVVFSLIPFHFGRALGHTYLATLYSAVTGLALVLLIGSGRFETWVRVIRQAGTSTRTRVTLLLVIAALVVITAWTGVYYVAFTLILGTAALIWRLAHRASWRALLTDAVPLVAVGVLAVVGFLPSILTTQGDPPVAQLSERLPYESVLFAGNLAVAVLPLPQSNLPGMNFYNASVVEAIGVAGWGESTAITNHGTWITTLALLTTVIALIVRARRGRPDAPEQQRYASLTFISYLILVTLLWFVPWGLNYLFAGTVTAQIRAWNRWTPILLLLFLLGAAAALARTRVARNPRIAVPVAVIVLALTAVDSVLPFRSAYAINASEAAEITQAGRVYAADTNRAIPEECGVLQLPYMAYPEFGKVREINDYDHFWTSLTNPGKSWSYGAVKNTDAGIWSAQLPSVPTDEQVSLLRTGGFCAIHLDTRGYISEQLPALTANLEARFGAPIATGFDGKWLLFDMRSAMPAEQERADGFFHQPLITEDLQTVQPRESELEQSWWWMKSTTAVFTLTATRPETPVTTIRGSLQAPTCGARPVNLIFATNGVESRTTVIADPAAPTPFELNLPSPASVATLEVQAPGVGCEGPEWEWKRYAKVVDLRSF